MNVLVLEDDAGRQKIFARNLIGTDFLIVETAADAIQALEAHSWDYLFLDHDLGGEQMVESGPGTGYEVAEWLVNNPAKQPPNIIIHSFNPSGAENMKRALPSAIVAPGCWSSISLS
jgi:CheY-like chemotaxis protein